MNPSRKLGLAALSVIAMMVAATPGQAQSTTLAGKAQDVETIMKSVRNIGKTRVIVKFAVAAADVNSTAGLASRKAAVRAGQDAIIAAALGSSRAASDKSLTRMRIEPMFAIDVTLADLERLAADARVVTIYPDTIASPTLIDSVPLIKAKQVQKIDGDGTGFIVAILDTGVERVHDFIGKTKVVQGACFTSNSSGYTATCKGGATEDVGKSAGDPCTQDSNCTHGTHVAGIATGKLKNASAHPGAPKVGVAPKASLIAINVFSFSPSFGLGAFTSDQVRALEFVFDNRNDFAGLEVSSINMSLGGGGPFTANCDASSAQTGIINTLRSANIATAIASGNNGFTNGVSSPGCISSAITVGSTDKADVISSFSNSGDLVDVLAPGSSIQSSIVGNGFAFFNGTSMATPHVAGAWAALRTLHPSATVTDIENALESTGKKIKDTRGGGIHKKPRINLQAAEDAL